MKKRKTVEQNVEVFFRVSSLLHREVDRHFKYDLRTITLQQVKVIEEVFYSSPSGVNLKDLAERLGITSSAASQVVDGLVKDGLLLRIPSQTDRRSVLITFSLKMEEIHRMHLAFFKELLDRSLVGVPPHELETAVHVLNVLLSNLERETSQK
ncbi:MAG: MarR family transcriptional regulator [Kiritimatiellae bacterium]|nr:MarR family transcriptional regulator [Kiritimatiellia bacterium]